MRAIRKKKVIEEDYRSPIEVFEARPEQGLSTRQAEERAMAGWDNRPIEPPGKTVGQIIRSNIFTYFNMLFFLLAVCVIVVGRWQEAMFLGVVFANIVIGIVQELRSKATLDKLERDNLTAGVMKTKIRAAEGIVRAEESRQSIFDYDGGSQVAQDYKSLAEEITDKIGIRPSEEE